MKRVANLFIQYLIILPVCPRLLVVQTVTLLRTVFILYIGKDLTQVMRGPSGKSDYNLKTPVLSDIQGVTYIALVLSPFLTKFRVFGKMTANSRDSERPLAK